MIGFRAGLLHARCEDWSQLSGLLARALEVGKATAQLRDCGGEARERACRQVGNALGGGQGRKGGDDEGVLHYGIVATDPVERRRELREDANKHRDSWFILKQQQGMC